jgi:hypothetical protein
VKARAVQALLLLALSGAAAAQAPARARRGPLESREEFLLAQPRLTLPAATPDPLAVGETRLRLDGDWGNDFGFSRRRQRGETDLRFLVDGEHRSLALEVRHGLRPSLTLGARLPLRWRGPGVLDGLIDAWHGFTGLPDNARDTFPVNRLRVEGRDERFQPVRWSGRAGTGLGNAELSAHWALRPPAPDGWALAAVGRLDLPTGTGPFAAAGFDAGAQLLAAHGLGAGGDVYLGAGATRFGQAQAEGIAYARARAHGFVALEWRAARRLSLLVETSAASRLVESFAAYPGLQIYFRGGAKLDLGRARLEGGFVEGLKSVQNTTDFGVMFGVSRSF